MNHSPEAPVLCSPGGLQWGPPQTYSGLNTVNRYRGITEKKKKTKTESGLLTERYMYIYSSKMCHLAVDHTAQNLVSGGARRRWGIFWALDKQMRNNLACTLCSVAFSPWFVRR